MNNSKKLSDLFDIRFDNEHNLFHLKSNQSSSDKIVNEITIETTIKLSSKHDNTFVNISLPYNNYHIYKFFNPYLNAQNDIFKIKVAERAIGYIFPSNALESEINDEDFNEIEQAYKFYCIFNIIGNMDSHNLKLNDDSQVNYKLNNLLDEGVI